jgi:fibronectin type 3 domain-containing protein
MKKKTFARNMIGVTLIWIGAALAAGCGPEESAPETPPETPPYWRNNSFARSENSITLAWQVVDNAESYIVYRSNAANGEYVAISGEIASASYTDTDLQPSTTYYYKVAARNAAGTSPLSGYTYAATLGLVSAPTQVSASAQSESSIAVSWKEVDRAESYIVYRSNALDGEYAAISGEIAGLSYTDTGLRLSATYYYKVAARNAAGAGERSSAVAVTIAAPAVPVGVSAMGLSTSGIRVSWNAVEGAKTYIVYRSDAAEGEYAAISGEITGLSYTDSGLQASTAYYYKVAAKNALGTSAQSYYADAAKLPDAPASFGLYTGGYGLNGKYSMVSLSWSAVDGATHYYVYRASDTSGYTQIASTTSTSYEDRTVSNRTLYYYKVAAANSGGIGPLSSEQWVKSW